MNYKKYELNVWLCYLILRVWGTKHQLCFSQTPFSQKNIGLLQSCQSFSERKLKLN